MADIAFGVAEMIGRPLALAVAAFVAWRYLWPRIEVAFAGAYKRKSKNIGAGAAIVVGLLVGAVWTMIQRERPTDGSTTTVSQTIQTNANPVVNNEFSPRIALEPGPQLPALKLRNKYLCQAAIKPLFGKGKYAHLIEFAVRDEASQGFHTQITLSGAFLEVRQWLGEPRRTDFRGVEFGSTAIPENRVTILNGIPNIYDITTCTKRVTHKESLYVYFADDEPIDVVRVTYADSTCPPQRILMTETDFDECVR